MGIVIDDKGGCGITGDGSEVLSGQEMVSEWRFVAPIEYVLVKMAIEGRKKLKQ